MAKSGSNRLVGFAAALIFLASLFAAAFFAFSVYGIFCERKTASDRVASLDNDVKTMRRFGEYQKEYHRRLVNDDEFAARVIRETLGYSAPGEIVFKFDEKTFSQKGGGVSVERDGSALNGL